MEGYGDTQQHTWKAQPDKAAIRSLRIVTCNPMNLFMVFFFFSEMPQPALTPAKQSELMFLLQLEAYAPRSLASIDLGFD